MTVPSRPAGRAGPPQAGDAALLLRIPLSLALAKLLPERWWMGLARAIAQRRLSGCCAAARETALLRDHLGDRLDEAALRAVAAEVVMGFRLRTLILLRELGTARTRVRTRLEGREHLEGALAAGRGAVLWVAPFHYGSIGAKAALHAQGYALVHLSRPTHGFGDGWASVRLLNRLVHKAESKFLAERVVIETGSPGTGAVRTLRRRLGENRLVSITVGAEASATQTLPLLAGKARLAAGPVELARRAGAPLLPLFTLRAADGTLVTTVEPPLIGTAAEQLRDYASRLGRWVERAPGQVMWLADIFVA